MPRIIKVESCTGCPHNDHLGAFAAVSCVPICRLANRSQPYKVVPNGMGGAYAVHAEDIPPDWCPLEQYEPRS